MLLWRTGEGLSYFLLVYNVYKETHIKWKIFLFIHVHAAHTGPVGPGSFMNLAGFDFIDIFPSPSTHISCLTSKERKNGKT